MTNRSRTITIPGPLGHWQRERPIETIVEEFDRGTIASISKCDDEVIVGNNGNLTVDKYFYSVGTNPRVTAQYMRLGYLQKFIDFPVNAFADWSTTYVNMAHPSLAGRPTTAQAVARLLRDTNPSRPQIDLPVFAVEMREIPNLLFKKTSDTGRDIASGRLSLEYGWKPLIRDIQAAFDFAGALSRRVKELKALRTSGLRRKRSLWKGSNVYTVDEQVMNHHGMSIYYKGNRVALQEVTGFVKWVPSGLPQRLLGLPSDNDEEIQAQAAQALLGFSNTVVDASTLWEVLPFSWLLDWFGNTGDYLAASRNIVQALPTKIAIMNNYRLVEQCRLRAGGDVGYGFATVNNDYFVREHTTKSRTPASLTLSAHLPFLTERQVMILADITRSSGFRYR